jgi:hypothetical protein
VHDTVPSFVLSRWGSQYFSPNWPGTAMRPPLNGMAGITTMPSFWFRWEFSTFELGLALNLVPPIASLQDYRHEP